MRLFLDANVLFTAIHNPRGKAALVIELSTHGLWTIYSSDFAVEEARRNLARKFPEFVDEFDALADVLRLVGHSVGFCVSSWARSEGSADFQAAIACRATHLLTGDMKHFGAFMNQPERISGIRIQTVAGFLDRLVG